MHVYIYFQNVCSSTKQNNTCMYIHMYRYFHLCTAIIQSTYIKSRFNMHCQAPSPVATPTLRGSGGSWETPSLRRSGGSWDIEAALVEIDSTPRPAPLLAPVTPEPMPSVPLRHRRLGQKSPPQVHYNISLYTYTFAYVCLACVCLFDRNLVHSAST